MIRIIIIGSLSWITVTQDKLNQRIYRLNRKILDVSTEQVAE